MLALLGTLLLLGGASALPIGAIDQQGFNSSRAVSGTVLRVHATTDAAEVAEGLAIDTWKKLFVGANRSLLQLDLQVSHEDVAQLRAIRGLTVMETMHEDLFAVIKAQAATRTGKWDRDESKRVLGAKNDPFFDEYHPHDEIVEYMRILSTLHPETAEFEFVGQSLDGVEIPALVIGGTDNGPLIFNQCGLHAREWITHATCMYLIVELLESEDPAVRRMVQDTRFVFIVDANPDGYIHSWTASGRMQRKNMRQNAGSTCIGVDLNRNFDDHWNLGVGGCSSTNPCSQTFHGASAASEPETQACQRTLDRYVTTNTVLGGLDWHSYGNLILRPWGWSNPSTAVPPNDPFVGAIGQGMSDAMLAVNGIRYASGPSFGLYPVCGCASDYLGAKTGAVADEQGVGICVELRPATAGGGGFVLPDDQIVPTGEENWAGFLSYTADLMASYSNTKQ